jgi:phosphocarrier protein FPr
MTGIVVVSHSRALAEAAVALASEMVHGSQVRVTVAAGLDEDTFGTDAVAIAEAVREADDGTGVVVLMDLGSAVLSAELALDLIDDTELQARVVLCPAPLVEGLVVAAVAAAGGATPAEVAAEAVGSLAAKQSQVGPPSVPAAGAFAALPPTPDQAVDVAESAVFEVENPHGLHARPAARLVQEARRFDASIQLRNLSTHAGPVTATSLSKVATLGALRGHRVEVSASGAQAHEAVEHLIELAARHFDETDASDVAALDPAGGAAAVSAPSGRPLAASPGIAIGPALTWQEDDIDIPAAPAGEPGAEWRRILEAIGNVRTEIDAVRTNAAREVGEAEARIFDAHLMLLDDDQLLGDVHALIDGGESAPRAWADAVGGVEAELAAMTDPYLRARAADVRAVGQHVLRALVGAPGLHVDGEGVLVADDLTPAQAAELEPSSVRGIVLAGGSPTGHSAILARSRGIPAIVAAGGAVLDIAPGTTIGIDGGTGELFVEPDPAVLDELECRLERARSLDVAAREAARSPAETADGVHVDVAANIGSVDDARAAFASGADQAGLVRTEFVFLGRDKAPTVDEQADTYRAIATALGGRRITLRTLDVGGDKPLGYAAQPVEANPFLGVRGIRFALAQHELLSDQLAAVVSVAHDTPVSVMFPMVSTIEEFREARRRLEKAIDAEGRGRPAGLEVGIMVEVPAAALKAGAFADDVDFFSVGTNDLTQYTVAAERGNPAVAGLADPLDPGVLKLIQAVCTAADGRAAVAVCGELAADEQAARLLVALGVRELSVAPAAIPGVKQAVRASTADDRALVARCLDAPGAAEVRALLG